VYIQLLLGASDMALIGANNRVRILKKKKKKKKISHDRDLMFCA
jgi:hypothetical protein